MIDEYTVYTEWPARSDLGMPASDGHQVGIRIHASSHQDAADQRLARLGKPGHYTSLAVVGDDRVKLFTVETCKPTYRAVAA